MTFNNKKSCVTFAFKRTFDIILSIPLLIISIPFVIIACLSVYITSGWPVIIFQERVGRDGKLFQIYKIRTMTKNAQLIKHLVYRPRARENQGKLADDPRVTKVGKFLRRSSIDELAQLINVILGNMSLVGPRPQEADTLKAMPGYYNYLKYFRPGITGLAQIYGRGILSYRLTDCLNGWYVRIWRPKLDIVILLKTIIVVFQQKGAS